MTVIYKILGDADWQAARARGEIAPAGVDIRDGFIHLSAEGQALETARLHFAGRSDLVAVAFDAGGFGDALKWEASRGGELFPHLYAPLATAAALGARRLIRREGAEGYDFDESAWRTRHNLDTDEKDL